MSFAKFKALLANTTSPELSPALLALWHDGRGDWQGAHRCVQDDGSVEAAWVHAYLHRKEGDAGNAAYWYARAHRPVATGTLADEWAAIAQELLGEQTGEV